MQSIRGLTTTTSPRTNNTVPKPAVDEATSTLAVRLASAARCMTDYRLAKRTMFWRRSSGVHILLTPCKAAKLGKEGAISFFFCGNLDKGTACACFLPLADARSLLFAALAAANREAAMRWCPLPPSI